MFLKRIFKSWNGVYAFVVFFIFAYIREIEIHDLVIHRLDEFLQALDFFVSRFIQHDDRLLLFEHAFDEFETEHADWQLVAR